MVVFTAIYATECITRCNIGVIPVEMRKVDGYAYLVRRGGAT